MSHGHPALQYQCQYMPRLAQNTQANMHELVLLTQLKFVPGRGPSLGSFLPTKELCSSEMQAAGSNISRHEHFFSSLANNFLSCIASWQNPNDDRSLPTGKELSSAVQSSSSCTLFWRRSMSSFRTCPKSTALKAPAGTTNAWDCLSPLALVLQNPHSDITTLVLHQDRMKPEKGS